MVVPSQLKPPFVYNTPPARLVSTSAFLLSLRYFAAAKPPFQRCRSIRCTRPAATLPRHACPVRPAVASCGSVRGSSICAGQWNIVSMRVCTYVCAHECMCAYACAAAAAAAAGLQTSDCPVVKLQWV